MSVRYPASSIERPFLGHGLLAADAGSSRLVYAMVFALIVIGVALIVLAVVVFRRTRVDLAVLAPLERMGSRKWRKGDPESRRELLDAVRPAGATGPVPADDVPVGLPPPVIESASEAPHEATFVAGPDGVEPVEHVEDPVPVEEPVPVEDVEPLEDPAPVEAPLAADVAAEPAETTEPVAADPEPVAAEEPADDAVVPADVALVEEPVASDDAVVAADDAGSAEDDAAVDGDEAITASGDVPAVPAEPVDGSVTGQ